MENPQNWGRAERIVNDAMGRVHQNRKEMRCGYSDVMIITNALREAGLLAGDPEV